MLGALLVAAAAAWAYTAHLAARMGGAMHDMPMAAPAAHPWTPTVLVPLWVMWSVMMVAMMLPSAMPMILMFATINRRRRERHDPFVPTAVFAAGYLLAWSTYSLAAAGAQWGLHAAALLSPTMASTSPVLGGGVLIAAGAYQWSPLKRACLAHCRSPIGFLTTAWREGRWGALCMGVHHGTLCVGCCWLLMALLFVAGVMNLLWVAAIATFVLIEKLAPAARWTSSVAGTLLVAWGAWLLATAPW